MAFGSLFVDPGLGAPVARPSPASPYRVPNSAPFGSLFVDPSFSAAAMPPAAQPRPAVDPKALGGLFASVPSQDDAALNAYVDQLPPAQPTPGVRFAPEPHEGMTHGAVPAGYVDDANPGTSPAYWRNILANPEIPEGQRYGLAAGITPFYMAGQAFDSIGRAFALPGDVATGKVDPMSEQGQGRALEMALTLGPASMAMPKPAGSFGVAGGRPLAEAEHTLAGYPENVLPSDFLRPGAPEATWEETLRAMRNQHALDNPPWNQDALDYIDALKKDHKHEATDPYGDGPDYAATHAAIVDNLRNMRSAGANYTPPVDETNISRIMSHVAERVNEHQTGERPTSYAERYGQRYADEMPQADAVPTGEPPAAGQALLPGVQSVFAGYSGAHSALAEHLDRIGMDGPSFAQAMFGDQHQNAHVSHLGGGKLQLSAAPVPGASMTRTIDPAKGIAKHDYFDAGRAQDGGLGKNLLRSQVDTYDQLGIHTVKVHANLGVGGYAWARYGFVPDKSSWASLQSQTLPKLEAVKDQLHPEVYADAQRLLASKDPKALWKLADKTEPVTAEGNKNPTGGTLPHDMSDEDVAWQGTLAKLRAQTEAGTPGQPVPGFQYPTRANPPGAPLQGETTTLGKHLFLGSSWLGKLDLRDPATRNRFDIYVRRGQEQ